LIDETNLLDYALKFLKCVNCQNKLDYEPLETNEGIIHCNNCKTDYPVIDGIPIVWSNFSKYLENRASLGTCLINISSSQKMKSFVKQHLSQIKNLTNDLYSLEEKWVTVYQKSTNSEFYDTIKNEIISISGNQNCIEYGCSIGIISEHLAKSNSHVFGIDKSFSAIKHAKQNSSQNVDYIISDILINPFENAEFDLVVALNILELVEPQNLIDLISKQIKKGFLLMSDPYDYERGPRTVSKPLDAISLRKTLENCGFKISENTVKPNFIPWNLQINPRTNLNYLCDLVVAKKE